MYANTHSGSASLAVRPQSSPQQPYMTYLTSKHRGLPHHALSSLIFTPFVQCTSDTQLTILEAHLINLLQPPLNQPFIQQLLASSHSSHIFPLTRFTFKPRPCRPIARLIRHRPFPQYNAHLSRLLHFTPSPTNHLDVCAATARNILTDFCHSFSS